VPGPPMGLGGQTLNGLPIGRTSREDFRYYLKAKGKVAFLFKKLGRWLLKNTEHLGRHTTTVNSTLHTVLID